VEIRFVPTPEIACFLGSCLKIRHNLMSFWSIRLKQLYVHPVTNETNGDKRDKCPLEEMGTNHPLSMIRGLSPVGLSLCLLFKEF
jgi:hypothetical protein